MDEGQPDACRPANSSGSSGESGCGKSTLLFAIAQLLSPPAEVTSGRVVFRGQDLVRLTDNALRLVRWRDYSVVMQSAMNALNPMKSIGAQFKDTCARTSTCPRTPSGRDRPRCSTWSASTPTHLDSYPHQLSGGMRQRAMIAMALLFTPQLVIMDEPTSALDVVAQRSLMTQIKELQQKLGFAVIFVTHDMSVIANYSDRRDGHVRRSGGRARRNQIDLRAAVAPVQQGSPGRVPVGARSAPAADRDTRKPAGPGTSPVRVAASILAAAR